MAPEIPIDMHLGTTAWIGTIQANPVMNHRQLIILIDFEGLPPHLWKLRHPHQEMRIEAINESVDCKVKVVVIVAKLVTDIITSGDDEMMMVHQNHQIQVMMTTMEDHIDLLIGGIGSVNANIVTKGHNVTA